MIHIRITKSFKNKITPKTDKLDGTFLKSSKLKPILLTILKYFVKYVY